MICGIVDKGKVQRDFKKTGMGCLESYQEWRQGTWSTPEILSEKVRSYVPDEEWRIKEPKVVKAGNSPDIDYAFFDNLCG